MLQLLKPACLELVLCSKRSHRNEKPVHRNEEQPPLPATRESLRSNEDLTQPKKKKKSPGMEVGSGLTNSRVSQVSVGEMAHDNVKCGIW